MSDFTLSYIKIRDTEFFLEVGDIISSNMEGNYSYHPKGSENRGKLAFRQWNRDTSIEITKKYHTSVENATNFKLVKETPSWDVENRPELRHKEWIVESVEEVIIDEIDLGELHHIELSPEKGFVFSSEEIEKNTPKQITLKNHLGNNYWTVIKKDDINVISGRYGTYFVYCMFDDIDRFRDELYERKKTSLENILANAKIEFNKFHASMEKEGYQSQQLEE